MRMIDTASAARVLIVDDEHSIRVTLQAFLQAAGYVAHIAADVARAQEMLVQEAYDVVVSDIVLPRLSGMELLKTIRASAPTVQVIMMTGDPNLDTATQAVRDGSFDYLVKPISKDLLLQSVSRAAQLKLAHDEKALLATENQHYREHLELLVGERTAELQKTNTRLEAALEEVKRSHENAIQQERLNALGQMVGGIAHDFNNALVPIICNADMMLDDADGLADLEEVRESVEAIRSAAQDAREIVRRLREFYRPDEGLEAQPVDMNQLLAKVVDLTAPAWRVQAQAAVRSIVVKQELQPHPSVMGNEFSLRELFTNLIINAVDAMPSGGTITIRTYAEPTGVGIDVIDTGEGMSEEARRRCLEPFFTTKGEDGTGLGLAMCYGIIQRHGGSIEIESRPGAGTTFSIHLPTEPPHCRTVPSEEPRPDLSREPRALKVLIVDDEERIRQLLAKCLTRKGHTVETACEGEEGLAKLRAGQHDVLVTDRAMPGLSGDQMAVQANRASPGTGVVMLTGFGDLMQFRHECPEGVDEVVAKPVAIDELLAALQRAAAARSVALVP